MEIEKLICHHSAAKEHINFGYTILFPDYFHFFPTAFSFAGVRVVKEVRTDTLAYVFTEVSVFNSCPEG